MGNGEPEKLYRYRSMKRYKEVIDGYLWLGPCTDFNDPFDSWFEIEDEKNKELIEWKYSDDDIDWNDADRLRKASIDLLIPIARENRAKKYTDKIKDRLSKIRAACFSEDPLNILMWSHYANSHTGFCVEYDFKKLLSEVRLQNADLHKVVYQEKIPIIPKKDIDNKDAQIEAVIRKSPEWEYEKEWRVISTGNVGKIKNLTKCITRVIIGCEGEYFSPEAVELKKFCDREGIETEILYLRKSLINFKLEEDPSILHWINGIKEADLDGFSRIHWNIEFEDARKKLIKAISKVPGDNIKEIIENLMATFPEIEWNSELIGSISNLMDVLSRIQKDNKMKEILSSIKEINKKDE